MAKYLEVIDGVVVGGVYDDNAEGFSVPNTWVDITEIDDDEEQLTPVVGYTYDGTSFTATQSEDERLQSRDNEKTVLLQSINDDILEYHDTKALQDAGESGFEASMTEAEYISALKYREDLRAWDMYGTDDAPTRS